MPTPRRTAISDRPPCGSTRAPSSRSGASTMPRSRCFLHGGSVALRVRDRAGGRRVRARDRGRAASRADGRRATASTGSTGRAISPSTSARPGSRGRAAPWWSTPDSAREFWLEANGAAQYSVTDADPRRVRRLESASASAPRTASHRLASSRPRCPARATSTATDAGNRTPSTARSGIRAPSPADWAPYRHRPLGLDPAVGLDLGRRRALGLRAVPLRPLGLPTGTPGAGRRAPTCARPVYAPALVAWVGGPGANVSLSVGGGPAVGWFPLAPREVYVPAYRVSPRYVRDVNHTHVRNVLINRQPAVGSATTRTASTRTR